MKPFDVAGGGKGGEIEGKGKMKFVVFYRAENDRIL